MNKELQNMPDHVRNSAWANSYTFLGAAMRRVADWLYLGACLPLYFAWWTYAYWLAAEYVPFARSLWGAT